MNVISHFSNSINNNYSKYKHFIKYRSSKFILDISKLLFQEALIRGFFLGYKETAYFIIVLLKHNFSKFFLNRLTFISNRFILYKKNTKYKNGLGLFLISTKKGCMVNMYATKLKLGGILFMKIT